MIRSVDDFVTCPFFAEHKIRKSKFHIHVLKCEKGREVDYCPFNRNHIVEKGKLNDHLSHHCQDMEIILPELKALNRDEDGRGIPSGNLYIPPTNYDESMLISDEWSKDVNTNPPYIHGQIKSNAKAFHNSTKESPVVTGYSAGLRPGFGRGITHSSIINGTSSSSNKTQRLGANFGKPSSQISTHSFTTNMEESPPVDVQNLFYPPGFKPRGPRKQRGEI